MCFLRSWKCLITWNSPEQPVESTQKLEIDIIVVTIAGHCHAVFNAVELHILKLLTVDCSNTACSSSMQTIFNK